MAKFTSIIIATVALLAGAQAACPPNGFFCGSELIDVYKCVDRATLQRITPPFDEVNTDIYPTTADGTPQIPSASCKERGCRNSNGNQQTPPTVFARCN